MQSTANDLGTYMQNLPSERQACLQQLRSLCLEMLAGYEEAMDYGMPGYKKNGVVEIAFASQKNYISLYIRKQEVVDAHRDMLAGLNVGKGCIRYTKPDKVDFAIVQSLLAATVTSSDTVC